MGSLISFVKNTKIYKRLFNNNLLNPKLYAVQHPLNFLLGQRKGGQFNRYDTIVRLLAIEHEFGKNDFGWDLYLKMQKTRQAFSNKEIKSLDAFKSDFLSLIQSIKENGFDDKFPIMTNKSGELSDGSHRLASAIFFNEKEVKFKSDKNDRSNVDYGIGWFEENGFSEEEVGRIRNRFVALSTANLTSFMALLWSPAAMYKEEVVEDIKEMYEVKSVEEIAFTKDHEYAAFVRGMYAIDDIDGWKIEKKLEYMAPFPKKAVVILFDMGFPDYRKKTLNGKPLSKNVEKLKKRIRDKYSKRIDRYFYDIVLHIGDNGAHTVHMNKILDKDLPIASFLGKIRDLQYVALKTEAPYQPDNFPETYPLGKDLDILCSKEDYEAILKQAYILKEKYSEKYEVKVVKKGNGEKIRFELNGFLCYQIDLSWDLFKIKGKDVPPFLNDRITNGKYFTLTLEKELLVRCFEYLANQKKTHHLDFIKKYSSHLNWDLMNRFLTKTEVEQFKKWI